MKKLFASLLVTFIAVTTFAATAVIDFTGKIVDISGNVLSGDNWSVSIFDGDTLIRNCSYAYSYDIEKVFENDDYYYYYDYESQEYTNWLNSFKTSFKFENLPISTYVDSGNSFNPNSTLTIERQRRIGIMPGTYDVKVKYKNKVVKTFPMTFDKERDIELSGAYKNISLNVGEVLKNFRIQFIDRTNK